MAMTMRLTTTRTGGDGPLGASSRDPRAAFAPGLMLLTVTGAAIVALVVPLIGPVASLLGLPSGTEAGWLVIGVASGVLMAQWQTLIGVPYMLRRPLAYLLSAACDPRSSSDCRRRRRWRLRGGARSVPGLGDRRRHRPGGVPRRVPAGVSRLRGPPDPRAFDAFPRAPSGQVGGHQWPGARAGVGGLARDRGVLRLASRLTMPVEFPAAAFFQAWLPMQKSPIVLAADYEEVRACVRAVATTFLTFVVCGLLVLFLAALDLLDEILPDAYKPSIGSYHGCSASRSPTSSSRRRGASGASRTADASTSGPCSPSRR
jgi:hypothetical protein